LRFVGAVYGGLSQRCQHPWSTLAQEFGSARILWKVGASRTCQPGVVRANRCRWLRPSGGYSSMVEQQPSKLNTRVRFPLPAPKVSNESSGQGAAFAALFGRCCRPPGPLWVALVSLRGLRADPFGDLSLRLLTKVAQLEYRSRFGVAVAHRGARLRSHWNALPLRRLMSLRCRNGH
jgi:hypothetical protein